MYRFLAIVYFVNDGAITVTRANPKSLNFRSCFARIDVIFFLPRPCMGLSIEFNFRVSVLVNQAFGEAGRPGGVSGYPRAWYRSV